MMPIRKLEPADLPAYRSLRLRALTTDPAAFHLTLGAAEREPDTFFLSEMLPEGRFGTYGWFEGAQLKGMVTLRPLTWQSAQLFTLYVVPEARKKGIASSLLTQAEQTAREMGLPRLQLTIMKDNLALSWYRRRNYQKLGTVPGVPEELVLERHLEA